MHIILFNSEGHACFPCTIQRKRTESEWIRKGTVSEFTIPWFIPRLPAYSPISSVTVSGSPVQWGLRRPSWADIHLSLCSALVLFPISTEHLSHSFCEFHHFQLRVLLATFLKLKTNYCISLVNLIMTTQHLARRSTGSGKRNMVSVMGRKAGLLQIETELPSHMTGFCLPLAIVENMAEFRPEMCTEAAQQGLLQWLLKRLKVSLALWDCSSHRSLLWAWLKLAHRHRCLCLLLWDLVGNLYWRSLASFFASPLFVLEEEALKVALNTSEILKTFCKYK